MKKVMTVSMILLFLVSFVWAENSNQAVKRVQWSREMVKLSQSVQVKNQSEIQNTVRLNNDREKMMQAYMGKTHHERATNKTNSRLKVFDNRISFQPAQKSLSKSAPSKAASVMPMDTLRLFSGVQDTINYIAGASFVFQIMSSDTVVLEFYVDNGDSIFDDSDFFIDLDMDHEEEIKVWDGAEFDESPAGDGIFQVTMNTMSASEGPEPFFGLQNCIVYVTGWNVVGTENFEGVALVGAPDENTSIEGTVLMEDVPAKFPSPAAANLVVWAAKIPADTLRDWEPEVFFLTMTDEFGYYRIEIPDMYQGDYMVGVADIWSLYPGYFPDPPEIDLYVGGDISPVDFTLIQGKETIYGLVEDENGIGISDIHLYAYGDYGETQVVTNTDGSFEIPAMPGWWEVGIEEDDIYGQYMIPWSRELEVFDNGDHPVNFTLYSLDASFTGNVATSVGVPMADIEMYTDVWMGMDGGYYTWAYTDEFGNYILNVSTALQGIQFVTDWGDTTYSSYWITAWSDDVLFMPDAYYDQYAPADLLDFTALIPDASLSGIVYDAGNNNPLYDAQIHVYQMTQPVKGSMPGGLDFWTFTDESGYYEVPLMGGPYPGDLWMIEVYWPYEWMPSVIDSMLVLSGNNYTKDYYISPPVTEGVVEGYVYNENGAGISGAHVELYNWNQYFEIYTDDTGYFRLEHIPFDWYSATANVDGYEPYNIDNIWVGEQPTYLEFWMGSIVGDIFLDGFVVDENNTPIPGAFMLLFNWEFNEPFSLFTDDSGHFELNVKPGWYDIQVGANGYSASNQGFDIEKDTTLTMTITSFPMIADTLYGSVVDDGGNPLRKVFVYAELDNYNDTNNVVYMGYTFTDINGQYEIALPAGNINASFSKTGFNREWRNFDWPSSPPDNPIVLYPEVYIFGPELLDVIDVPEDHGKQVRLTWKRAEGMQGSVKEYQIWRAIEPFNSADPNPDMTYSWDYVTTVPVHPDMEIYNVVVPTLYDAIGDNIYWTGFVVTAIGWDNWSFWNSNMMAGFSIDNLPPEVPMGLTAAGDGANISLQWEPVTSEKVKYYSIYRKTASTEFEVIGYATLSEYVDEGVSTSESYEYTVTATDFGLNESGKSEPVYVGALAVEDASEIPTEFALKPNYPNPFNPETTIEFALPQTSKVTMTIYNLTGQMVRQLVQSEYVAGYHRVIWNGRDSRGNMVGSGVYIYTLKADNFSQTRKMILLR